jgi:hypothetical protein
MTIELEVSIQVEIHPDGSSPVGIADCGALTLSIIPAFLSILETV